MARRRSALTSPVCARVVLNGMGVAATWLSRLVWLFLLRILRLGPIRNFRRGFMARIPEHVRLRMIKQDRFARRHGLKILRFSMMILLGSVATTLCYFAALYLVEAGIIFRPNLQR